MASGTERQAEAFVQAALQGTRFATVRWVSETGSTNVDLAEAAANGEPEQVLVTDLQTAGKGRRGRVWDSPAEAGVLMSVLVREVDPADAFWAVGAVALAASQAIDELIEPPCRLKWPNDVLILTNDGDRKVAGVLAQVVEGGIVVGIGTNANWPKSVPEVMAERGTAVSRHLRSGDVVDRPALAAQILLRAIGHLASDRATLRSEWKRGCATLNRRVRLELEGSVKLGIATDIADDGALQIEENGVISTYQVGDIVHLRAET
jgi:BirA family biotin operon repressor/biotin-[acetyl-CoA-carboxylase] ligase